MSRHRALRARVRRGVAKWPVAIVALVALLGLGYLGWTWVGGVLEDRAAAQAKNCSEGEALLRIAATPTIADSVVEVAKAWSAQRPVVYDHCIVVEVKSVEPQVVQDSLTTTWDEAKLGGRPHAWLPDSSLWANRLAAQNRALLGAEPKSIATSPVLLAVPEAGAQALMTGNSFRWTDLPDVTNWAKYGQAAWGRFSVAMPDPATNTATAMAIQSALAGASPTGKGPVTVEMLAMAPVKSTMSKLAAAQGETTGSTFDLLAKLSEKPEVNSAGFSGVPVFEVDLYRHNLGKAKNTAPAKPVVGVAAGGPTPVADFPYVPLAGEGVGEAEARAAQAFREFLMEPDQQKILARGGLRVESSKEHPNPSPGVRWAVTTENLVPADENTTQQISAAWATADNGGQVVTLLVDVSASMKEPGGDGKSRLDWLKTALKGQVDRSVSGSLGLWEFSRNVDGDKPYKQVVATGPVGQQRDALVAGIDGLQPVNATHLYSSLAAVYGSAQQGFQTGKPNRIVVITDGRNDGGIDLAALKDKLKELKKNDVVVSFIAVGSEPDRQALTDIAKSTGGTLSVVEDGKGIDPALGQLLSEQT
ncbi:VWA domain-containing protein [Lentzea tibetensis]|uniref:VWA domain-containing protein n=1 Tax=Lentzea tibetensis TaxID=2591470 RepID=A0A563EXK4_9PSEU|nr:substrate-binding domain-containing protein [Lentzea tibetensis]TWP52201.1 VWA domain-containing protein [Lentzea tibetensis]